MTHVGIDAVERELIGGAIVVMREIDAIPASLLRISRLAIVDLDERLGSDEIDAGVETGHLGRRERARDIGNPIVLPFTESRRQVFQPAANEQVLDRSNTRATTEVVRANRVVGPFVPV